MHGYIYEMTTDVVEQEDWAAGSDFYGSPHCDFVRELDDEERKDAIEHLKTHEWFNKLFEYGDEEDTIVFKGSDAVKEMKSRWMELIQESLNTLKESNGFSQYDLRRVVDFGEFAGFVLFCLSDYLGTYATTPNEFFDWIYNMKDGTVIHINSVFDYHY